MNTRILSATIVLSLAGVTLAQPQLSGTPEQLARHLADLPGRVVLTSLAERTIEAELSRLKPAPERRPMPVPGKAVDTPRALLSNRLEEDYLAYLLKYPELKANTENVLPEYFLNSR